MINKFIAGLSPLGKKLFVVAFLFVVFVLFDVLLISPTMSRMATIDTEIVKEESNIKQDLHFLGYKNKILTESKALEPYLTLEVPSEEVIISGFLKKMEIVASKANVILSKVSPSTGSQEKEYLKYQADLECSGKLVDMVNFMHLINTSEDLMKVIKFNFSSKKADSDELKATMTIVKVLIAKNALPPKAQVTTPVTNSSAGAK